MNRFKNKTVKNDLNKSTSYDDQNIIDGNSKEDRLDNLTTKIDAEINACGTDILKLERLEERYHSDEQAALADNEMGYSMRYRDGSDRLKRIAEARYKPFHPVNDDGSQNVK